MSVDLRNLISHNNWVHANQSLGLVFQAFKPHEFDFMAVLEDGIVRGLCSRRNIGMSLGSQYGFSLFASKPIKGHMLPNPIFIKVGIEINEVFKAAFARSEEAFYEDVILLGEEDEFLGLIATETLVKLQNQQHLENIGLLERQSRELRLKSEQIDEDLRLSRELQQALLPSSHEVFPPRQSGGAELLRFHHDYQPYGLVGGDFFHIKKLGDQQAGVFIADVMGHGVRSALVTAMLRAMLGEASLKKFHDPAALMGHINRELHKILSRVEETTMFATALYVLVDAAEQTFRYATAAHPLPLHLQRQTGRAVSLHHPDPGTLLGVFEHLEFVNGEAAYQPGDALILFTDGISEAADITGEDFGLQRMIASIEQNQQQPTAAVMDGLLQDARTFVGSKGFSDDVCLVAVDLA